MIPVCGAGTVVWRSVVFQAPSLRRGLRRARRGERAPGLAALSRAGEKLSPAHKESALSLSLGKPNTLLVDVPFSRLAKEA